MRRPFPRSGVRTKLPVLFRRPGVDEFAPTDIEGLALWLDASDATSLYQNSDGTVAAVNSGDPVGYWRDKSGNNRHATQATAGSRPTVGASSTAGKNAVRNNGTGSVALQVAAWPYTEGNTQFAVFNASAINQGIAQRGSLNDEPRMAIQTGANGVAALRATRGGSVLTQTHSEAGYALSRWAIGATLFNTSLGRAYRDGVYGADTTDSQTFSGDQELRLLSLPSNIYGINGGIAEFLYYDRQLSAAEVGRMARYLATRWGITLAPQVANADAQDWINRVYANGGTVSTSTASAVNQFCNDIDAAGIRSLMYRANLFCGTGLNACLVPLYRGPSLGGTQYGGTTDTNVGPFVSGDYSETTGLLHSAGNAKWLDTGLAPGSMPQSVYEALHISAYHGDISPGPSDPMLLGATNTATVERMWLQSSIRTAPTLAYETARLGRATTVTATTGFSGARSPAFLLASRTGPSMLKLYRNGTLDGTQTATITGITVNSFPFYIFRNNNGGTASGDSIAYSIRAYSIGAGMTDTQAAAFSAAHTAFNAAMGRS